MMKMGDDKNDEHNGNDDDTLIGCNYQSMLKVRPVIAENPWLKNDKKRLSRWPIKLCAHHSHQHYDQNT